jgi:cobalt/nickel transport system permease protein
VHVPDGFLNAGTSIATGAVAVAAVAVALRRARHEQASEFSVPMVGLVSSFIFAGQMINFPVGAGTSGHLIGGAVAAVLVGPWTALLCISTVLVVQALLFADGGITALGTNITLMGVINVFVAWGIFLLVRTLLPNRPGALGISAGIGALVAVPAAAAGFTLLYALGGQVPIDLTLLATAMVGWHVIIGVGEAIVTAIIIGSVVRARPDLVHGARISRVTPTVPPLREVAA